MFCITREVLWVPWTCLATSIKSDNFHFLKLWCLSACKKWTPLVTSFFRYCKDIANLLLWVLWECLIMAIIMIVWTCRKLWYPNCWNQYVGNSDIYPRAKKKITFRDSVKTCKLAILGTSGMVAHSHQKL